MRSNLTIESGLKSHKENRLNKKNSKRLKKLIGSIKLPENFDEKKEQRSYYEKKHLRNQLSGLNNCFKY